MSELRSILFIIVPAISELLGVWLITIPGISELLGVWLITVPVISELLGVWRRPSVGLLHLQEHYRQLKVGWYLKNPLHPVWLCASQHHITGTTSLNTTNFLTELEHFAYVLQHLTRPSI
jgi:hypothetical protein